MGEHERPAEDKHMDCAIIRIPRRLEAGFKSLHFDIDKYLDPFIPRSRLDRLPQPISRFLGYRDTHKQAIGNVAIAAWSLFGGFVGTAILSGFFRSDFIKNNGGPIIIGSYGAAAILEFNAIESPFSQPRNAILGQFIAALVGTCITKLFAMNANFEDLRWLAGSLAVGVSSALMTLTGTIHPPAGATALLAAVDSKASGLGWLYLPIVLVSSILTTAVACLLNNIHRRYPTYWWTPHDLPAKQADKDAEQGKKEPAKPDSQPKAHKDSQDLGHHQVIISPLGTRLPQRFYLSKEEQKMLQILEERLREMHADDEDAAASDSHSDTRTSHEGKSDKDSM